MAITNKKKDLPNHKLERALRLIAILAAFALLVGLALLLIWSLRVYREASRVRDLAQEVRALMAQGMKVENLTPVCELMAGMDSATGNLERDLAPHYAIFHWMNGKVPGVGGYAGQVEAEIQIARDVSQFGVAVCRAALPAAQVYLDGGGAQRIAALLEEQAAELRRADDLLLKALAAGEKVDARYIPASYQGDYQALMAALPAARQALRLVLELGEGLALVQEARSLQSQGIKPEILPKAYDIAQRAVVYSRRLKQDLTPLYPLIGKLAQGAQAAGAVEPALEYVNDLAEAGLVLGQAMQALWQKDQKQNTQTGQEKLAGLLIDKQADFALAHELLMKAKAARAQIPTAYQQSFVALDGLLAQAEPVVQFLQRAPQLLGAGTPQTYLVMIQNRDELRATGGFVSAFGLARLDAGRLSMLEIEDSAWFDYVAEERQPPAPLGYIMQANYLVARDANWSPDFPTAARETQEMYALSTDVPTDGVIAFDQGLLANLLSLLGPVVIPNEGLRLDASNIESVMIRYKQAAIAAGNDERRKDFMALLAPALINHIKAVHDPKQQLELAKLMLEQVRSGHLQVYFNDTEAESLLHQFELDGAVRPDTGDYVMLVDSNLGFSKMDLYVERRLGYRVDLSDPQKPAARVDLTYKLPKSGSEACHQGVTESSAPDSLGYYFVRCYWDYWRVLLAPGASLKTAAFERVPASYFDDGVGWKNAVEASAGENGTQMLAGLVVVPPGGQTKEVTLEIRLPQTVLKVDEQKRLVYTLRVQKQAGIVQLPVEISVKAPLGYQLFYTLDEWSYDQGENFFTWRGNLNEKKDLQIIFEKSS